MWCASWSPGGQRFVTGCGDGIARIWSVNPPCLIQALKGHRAVPVDSVKWSNVGSRILTGCQDGSCRLWDFDADERRWVTTYIFTHDQNEPNNGFAGGRIRDVIKCTMVMWTKDDRYAITAFSNATIKVWDPNSGRLLHEFKEHTKEVRTMTVL